MEVFTFLMAQSQVLSTLIGLEVSPIIVQVGLLVGALIVLSFAIYYGLSLFFKILKLSEKVDSKEKSSTVKAKKKRNSPPAQVKKALAKKSEFQPIDFRLLLEGRDGWFDQIDLFWYVKYLSLYDSRLFLVGDNPYEGARALTINEDYCHQSINEAILSDLNYNKTLAIPKSIFAYPVYLSNDHWVLVLVDIQKRTIEYYDSRKNYPDLYYKGKSSAIYINSNAVKNSFKSELPYTKHYTNIDAHFKKFAKDLNKEYPGEKSFTFIRKFSKYVATNDDDCGPWTLYCLEQRLEKPDTNFDKLNPKPNMKEYRSTIAYNLATMDDYCKFKGLPYFECSENVSQNNKTTKFRC